MCHAKTHRLFSHIWGWSSMSSIHTALYSYYKDSQYGIDDKKTHKLYIYIPRFDHGTYAVVEYLYIIILIWTSLRIDRLTTTFWQHGKPNDTPPVRIAIQRASPTYLGKMIATSGKKHDDVTFLFGKFIPQTYLGCWEQPGIAIHFLLNQVNPNNMSNDLTFFLAFCVLAGRQRPSTHGCHPWRRGSIAGGFIIPNDPSVVGFQAIHERSTDRCHGYMGGILWHCFTNSYKMSFQLSTISYQTKVPVSQNDQRMSFSMGQTWRPDHEKWWGFSIDKATWLWW